MSDDVTAGRGDEVDGVVRRADTARVRTLTMNRPEALNAFNEALYLGLAAELDAAADDPGVAVVLLTGDGRAFSAGQDLKDVARLHAEGAGGSAGQGFLSLVRSLAAFPKPLIVAVNGIALGIGVTLLGFADLVFMDRTARAKTPFTDLGMSPEAASSVLFPRLMGHQWASWVLMSSEWLTAEELQSTGLVWKLCDGDDLIDEARRHAEVLAAKPISGLIAAKKLIVDPIRLEVDAAVEREVEVLTSLVGGPANREAIAAFIEGRDPDFSSLPDGA